MALWIVFTITLISHISLIFMFERQRKYVDSLRQALKRHRRTIHDLESQIRLASQRLIK